MKQMQDITWENLYTGPKKFRTIIGNLDNCDDEEDDQSPVLPKQTGSYEDDDIDSGSSESSTCEDADSIDEFFN